jgi:hypothetical protein
MNTRANELRIGNYLSGKQGHVTVTEIRENNMVKIHNNTSSFYVGTCLEPIPLTEEWLLKFGFAQINNRFTLENFRFHIEKPCNYHGFLFCENHIVITDKIKHVHQLQNLYFALTGEELTIK